jgi:HlyD family secretion protein
MKPWRNRRWLTLAALLVPLAVVFGYVALRSGPLAPVPVTVATVETRPIEPALHGIGTVDARYTHRVGPTSAGRVLRVEVDVAISSEQGSSLLRSIRWISTRASPRSRRRWHEPRRTST